MHLKYKWLDFCKQFYATNFPMKKKILIIDDDKDILEIIEFILVDEGYDVITSLDGEEVKRVNEINPDLILLDLRLSGTDTNGAEICTKLKAEHKTSGFPVILVSAEIDIKDVAHHCGANDYIKKPFDTFELSDKVKAFLRK
jgi:two-component system response regulator VicR